MTPSLSLLFSSSRLETISVEARLSDSDAPRRIGRIEATGTLYRGELAFAVTFVEVDIEHRRKGVATELYRRLAWQAAMRGAQLISKRDARSVDAAALWRFLEKIGRATVDEDGTYTYS